MPTEAKRAKVAELAAALSGSSTAIVSDYRGLSVADLQAIRRALRAQGVHYRVVKNRLARIAAQEAGIGDLAPLLEGPSALALGSMEESQVARAFLEAVRPYRTVRVRGGIVRQRRIEPEDVTQLATLPGREVLLAQLGGAMVSPLSSMGGLLAAPLRNLGYALQQVAARKAGAES